MNLTSSHSDRNKMEKQDILTRQDLIVLVNSFYEKVKSDSLLGPVFSHVDWVKHLPIMYNFWCTMLLGEISYKGNPLQSHLRLPIERTHFAQWLKLFQETVDAHFIGEKADETKMRAQAIAGLFQHKMGLMKPDIKH
jgi:hemoglobin